MSTAEPIKRLARIDSLTGLRFLAALHVMVFHEANWIFNDLAAYLKSLDARPDAIGHRVCVLLADGLVQLDANGPSSVSFFFVLSGFILIYTYHEKIMVNRFSRRNFWIARFARIYPVYLLGLILMLPFIFWSVKIGTQAFETVLRSGFLNLTLMQSWFPKDALSWNGPGWSLSTEAFFYLTFAFLAPFLARASHRRVFIGAIILFLLTKGLVTFLAGNVMLQPADAEWKQHFLALFPLFRLSEFTLGIAVGLIFLNAKRASGHVFCGRPLQSWQPFFVFFCSLTARLCWARPFAR